VHSRIGGQSGLLGVGISDPDCGQQFNCDVSQVSCELAVQCDVGKVPTSSGLCYGPCVEPGYCPSSAMKPGCCGQPDEDCANAKKCAAALCNAVIEAPDGTCRRAVGDCCRLLGRRSGLRLLG